MCARTTLVKTAKKNHDCLRSIKSGNAYDSNSVQFQTDFYNFRTASTGNECEKIGIHLLTRCHQNVIVWYDICKVKSENCLHNSRHSYEGVTQTNALKRGTPRLTPVKSNNLTITLKQYEMGCKLVLFTTRNSHTVVTLYDREWH